MSDEKKPVVHVSANTIGTKKSAEVFAKHRHAILKGDDSVVPRTNLADTDRYLGETFGDLGALEPPIDPLWLARQFSLSNIIRQCVDAMVTNIHLGGHTYEPVIDFESDEGKRRVRNAMIIEQEIEAEENDESVNIKPVSDKEIDERIEALKDQMWRERYRLDSFFENCCSKGTFDDLRQNIGTDQESTGHYAFEVRRDKRNRPRRLRWAPSWTMRALPTSEPVEVIVKERVADFVFREEKDWIDWRRFVQDVDGNLIYFKEFGDTRVMSSLSGVFYKDENELKSNEPNAKPASEIIWSRLSNPESEIYGLVRFAGNLLSVAGSREMESVNFMFFDNKAIPPMVVIIHGGEIADNMREEIESTIEEYVKGSENFHGILFLTASPDPTQEGREVQIEFRPLIDSIFSDQLWGEYDEANRMKVRLSFRLAQLLIGDSKDFNRATAESALRYTDAQVFAPMRRLFDLTMDVTILRALDIRLWRFKTTAPKSEDHIEVAKVLADLVKGVIGPEDARRILSRVWGIDLSRYEAEWAQMPQSYALAGFSPTAEKEKEKENSVDDDSDETTPKPQSKSTVARKVIDRVRLDKMFPPTESDEKRRDADH